MTEWAVTVEYTGTIYVEADSANAARDEVEHLLPHRMPDTDFYYTQVVDVQKEED